MAEQPKVAVIIPFYQKERGILRKAVESVLAQKGYENYEIIVVDDGSPVPAREELAELQRDHGATLRLVEQANTGPGGARNRGLDAVGPDARYVAFLDSDDTWAETHLQDAVYALEMGYDLYFAAVKHFSWRDDFASRVRMQSQRLVDNERRLFCVETNLFDIVVRPNAVVTSTVVYRFERYSTLRFRTEFCVTEDLLFLLDLFSHNPPVIFSDKIDSTYGRGVNIWTGAAWGDDQMFARMRANAKFIKFVLGHYCLNAEQRIYMRRMLNDARYSFVAALLHQLHTGNSIDMDDLVKQYKEDALTFVYFIPNVFVALWLKFVVRKQ